jgi:hypothetical protein
MNDLEGDFDGMDVKGADGQKAGEVDGFIVDSDSGRPYYVVVDSGGWFKSRRFLLPVGHVRLERGEGERDVLATDVPRERIERFPGFDKVQFEKFSDDDLRRFNDETCVACSISVVSFPAGTSYADAWTRPDFSYPSWWTAAPSRPDRMGESALTAGVEQLPPQPYRERLARDGAERAVGQAEASPHFEGRAQPGDVVGFETGGEQTHLGDTRESENERREEAERTAKK